MLMARCVQENVPLLYPPFPLVLPVNAVDTSAAATPTSDIYDPMQRGYFALFIGVYVSLADIQFVYWTAASSRRLAEIGA